MGVYVGILFYCLLVFLCFLDKLQECQKQLYLNLQFFIKKISSEAKDHVLLVLLNK